MRNFICVLSALTLSVAAAGAQKMQVFSKKVPGQQLSAVPRPAMNTPKVPVSSDADAASVKLFKPVNTLAEQWLKRPELQKSVVGLEIMDVPSGKVLFGHNGRKRLVTASTAKVLTTACAYDLLGGDFKYKTSLLGYGEIRGARLNGPLVIAPSQDPSINSEDVRQLLSGLDNRVKSIAGHVFVLPVTGGGDHFNTEWLVQDWGQDWMPVSSDFIIDRNVVLSRDPGRGYPLVQVTAEADTNALLSGLLRSPWAPAWVQFSRSNNSVLYFRPEQSVAGAIVVADPIDYNTAIVRSMLKSSNIKVDGRDVPAVGDPLVFAEHHSKPLSALIRFTLKESDNLYAQQLLRTIGTLPVAAKNLENASLEDRGLARLNSWMVQTAGVPAGEAVIWDGCGLSRKNAITPHALNMVLRHMSGASGNGPYIDLMIHEGEGPARSWRFKTGAMDSVRSITGIVKTSAGQPLAVTAIINDHTPSVRELRTSLAALINSLESLGALKFSPVVEKTMVSRTSTASSHQPRRVRRRSRRH